MSQPDTIPQHVREQLRQFLELTTEELRRELTRTMQATAHHMLRLAAIVHELDRRGDTLADLRSDLIGWLRKIATGQVLPDVVVRFQGRPLLINRVASLAIADQERIGRGESLHLVVREEGGYTHRMVSPSVLGREQIAQLFTPDGRIRSDGEQQIYLEEQALQAAHSPPKRERKTGRVRVDHEHGTIVVGRTQVTVAEALGALGELRGTLSSQASAEDTMTMPITLTRDEHRTLKIRAAQSDTTMSDLIRRALAAAGLLSERSG